MSNTKHAEIALSLLPAMRGMFAKLCHSEADLDDATQDGYLHLVEYVLPKWRGEGNVKTFALTAVKRKFFNRQALMVNRRRAVAIDKDGIISDGTNGLVDSHDAYGRAIEAQWLSEAMSVLTGDEKRFLALVVELGQLARVAVVLGVSRPTATRMRAKIRVKMEARM